jgi:hypothetical protein
MVKETTYSNARQSLRALCDEALSSREPVIITRRGAENVPLFQPMTGQHIGDSSPFSSPETQKVVNRSESSLRRQHTTIIFRRIKQELVLSKRVSTVKTKISKRYSPSSKKT